VLLFDGEKLKSDKWLLEIAIIISIPFTTGVNEPMKTTPNQHCGTGKSQSEICLPAW
jgi:hypothetical protein